MRNEVFGWLLITLGFATGALMGMRFQDPDWLGGYTARPRRLVRLGHIALIALGMLNLLFAHSAPRVALPPLLLETASWCFLLGAVAMPTACLYAASRERVHPVLSFGVPVTLLLIAAALTVFGLWSGSVVP